MGGWLSAVAAAERAGFDAVFLPAAGPAAVGPAADGPDSLTLAGGLAAESSLTLSVPADVFGARHPAVLCRDVITLDLVASGQTALMLFDSGMDPSDPWGRLGEAAVLCHALLTQAEPPVSGRYFRIGAVNDRPRPLRPGGPVLLAHVGGLDVAGAAAAGAGDPTGGFARCLRSVEAMVADVEPGELPLVRAAMAEASRAAGLDRPPALLFRAPPMVGGPPSAPGPPADGIIVRLGSGPPEPGVLGAVVRWWLNQAGSA
jgi:alkanesulfonate monooxygenase SsuD/methylene tetrahydromethanopterin reductase-like flavin-dependent oxidoreductase (luciferase family)